MVVSAGGIRVAVVGTYSTFVDVGAGGAIAVVSRVASAGEAAGIVSAGGIVVAVVGSGDAFVDVRAGCAVAVVVFEASVA